MKKSIFGNFRPLGINHGIKFFEKATKVFDFLKPISKGNFRLLFPYQKSNFYFFTPSYWRTPEPIRYAHWIAKLLYAMKIYIFCNHCDQEGPRKPIVVCFNRTRKEETRIHRCAQFWCPSLYNQRSHLLLTPLDKI